MGQFIKFRLIGEVSGLELFLESSEGGFLVIAHGQLIDEFGESGVVTMDPKDAQKVGISDLDSLILSHVGLPRHVGAVFTADVTGNPSLFSVQKFQAAGQDSKALFIGGPRDDPDMRYFLDVSEGFVVLFANGDTGPQAEIVNSDLSCFLEFIYRMGMRNNAPRSADESQGRAETEELAAALMECDPYAFRRSDTWWSMVIDQLRSREGDCT